MELLILLIVTHFIADFYLQPKEWIDCRFDNKVRSRGLYKHILVHCVLVGLVLLFYAPSFSYALFMMLGIGLSHFTIDLWKAGKPATTPYFLIDQVLHIAVIVSLWVYVNGSHIQLLEFLIQTITNPHVLIIVLAYILACKPASILISIILKRHTAALFSAQASSTTPSDPNIGLEAAGRWIGYIERCLTLTFLFMGQFSGIGFLVAAKTIFRFGDLTKNNDRQLTEYMLIGTLLSYTIALAIGWGTMACYRFL